MDLVRTLRRFCGNEDGAMSFFMLPLFTLLIGIVGVSWGLVYNVLANMDDQDARERAVLAAALMTEGLDEEQVVADFMANRTLSEYQSEYTLTVNEMASSKSVTVEGGYFMPTIFLSLFNVDTLYVGGVSEAFVGEGAVEISVVLDISGSMSQNTSPGTGQKRLAILRDAAKEFVSGILARPNRDLVSISIVPYSGQVNAGPFFAALADNPNEMVTGYPVQGGGTRDFPEAENLVGWLVNPANPVSMDALIEEVDDGTPPPTDPDRWHSYGDCIEFTDADFTTAELPALNSRRQAAQLQYFRFEGYFGHQADWGWCPTFAHDDTDRTKFEDKPILPFTNNETDLHDLIDEFRAHDGTGTQIGMKWGLALLDPSTQSLVTNLISSGAIASNFAGRPAEYEDSGTSKFLVLMTDGNIRFQNRPKESELENPTAVDHWAGGPEFSLQGYPYGSSITSSYVWNTMSLVWSYGGVNNPGFTVTPDGAYLSTIDEPFREDQFLALCDIARQKRIQVFTIGFDIETSDDAWDQMRACATTPSNFFDVDGLDLFGAFQQITAYTQKLRLVQ